MTLRQDVSNISPQDDRARVDRELAYLRNVADGDPERIWGWDTPAGRIRAQRRAALISDGAHLAPGVRVLEIGCGTGLFTEMFARSGAKIFALDLSAELLEHARGRGLSREQVQFIVARFEDFGGQGPYDAIIGNSVLHHLSVERSLRIMFDILKPGGTISFAEPNMLNPQVFIEREFSRFFPRISPDETAFVRGALASLLREIGFTDIKVTPFDWLHPATPPALIPAVQWLGEKLEKLPGVAEFSGSLYIKAMRHR